MVLSICTLENNKITYNYEIVKLTEEEIQLTISDSKILILVDNYNEPNCFVSTKYLRFFKDEKYNLDKTSYIIWSLSKYGYVFNHIKLLENISGEIKYIKFNNRFNIEPNFLPNTITHIYFGDDFNSNVDCLKYSIEYLHFSKDFNKPIDNLPGGLKKLLFNYNANFNQSLDNLPNFLEYLVLPERYTKTLDNLPNFLIEIHINSSYEHPLNNLPNSVEKIIFYPNDKNRLDRHSIKGYCNNPIPQVPTYYNPEKKIGTNIVIYNIDKIFGKLPNNLKYLDLTYSYKLNLYSDYIKYNYMVGKNIFVKKDLIKKNQPLDNLPDGLRVLKFPANYDLIQIDKIPQNIVKLYFSNPFNKSVDKLLNPNFGTNLPKPQTYLTHLIFGWEFNQPVNHLPDTILYLYFGYNFNQSVDKLPNSIIFISFGYKFNHSINNLPINLKDLELYNTFSQSLNNLKHGLKTIKFLIPINYQNNNIEKFNHVVKKLPSSLEKIYFPKIKTVNYFNEINYVFSKGFDKYLHLIDYY